MKVPSFLLAVAVVGLLVCAGALCAEDETTAIRKLIIDRASGGKKPTIFAPVFGKETKVLVVGANDRGITVSFMANDLAIPWKDLAAAQLGSLANELAASAADYVLLVSFYAANQMTEKAEKASAAALERDKNIGPELAAALGKLRAPTPEVPVKTPPAEKKDGADARKEGEKPKSMAERMGLPSGSGQAASVNHEGRTLPPMPAFKTTIAFDTPEADAILSAMPMCPKNSPWYEDISKRPVHPDSDKIIAHIGAGKNIVAYGGMNFIIVPPDQPRVPVKVVQYPGEADKGPFPVPDNVPIEGWSALTWENKPNPVKLEDVQRAKEDGDRHAIVADPVNNWCYDFFHMRKTDAGWQAGSIAAWNFNTNSVKGMGACNASGLPYLPSIVRYDEIQRGVVAHALMFTVSKTRKAFIWPAKTHAGHTDDPTYPSFGQRLRLKAEVDISKLPKDSQTICAALKKYGMLLVDNGADWDIYLSADHRVSQDACIRPLRKLKGSDFEVIVTTGEFEGPRAGDAR